MEVHYRKRWCLIVCCVLFVVVPCAGQHSTPSSTDQTKTNGSTTKSPAINPAPFYGSLDWEHEMVMEDERKGLSKMELGPNCAEIISNITLQLMSQKNNGEDICARGILFLYPSQIQNSHGSKKTSVRYKLRESPSKEWCPACKHTFNQNGTTVWHKALIAFGPGSSGPDWLPWLDMSFNPYQRINIRAIRKKYKTMEVLLLRLFNCNEKKRKENGNGNGNGNGNAPSFMNGTSTVANGTTPKPSSNISIFIGPIDNNNQTAKKNFTRIDDPIFDEFVDQSSEGRVTFLDDFAAMVALQLDLLPPAAGNERTSPVFWTKLVTKGPCKVPPPPVTEAPPTQTPTTDHPPKDQLTPEEREKLLDACRKQHILDEDWCLWNNEERSKRLGEISRPIPGCEEGEACQEGPGEPIVPIEWPEKWDEMEVINVSRPNRFKRDGQTVGFSYLREYDLRKKSGRCNQYISQIGDQCCGNCWAWASAMAIGDRRCIAFIKPDEILACFYEKYLRISMLDTIECAKYGPDDPNADGCAGGLMERVYDFYVHNRFCDEDFYPPTKKYESPASKVCSRWTKTCWVNKTERCKYDRALHVDDDHDDVYGCLYWRRRLANFTRLSGSQYEGNIRKELETFGSVSATLGIDDDFHKVKHKKKEIFKDSSAIFTNHGVRIIGYGVEMHNLCDSNKCWTEEQTKYWLVANSWGYDWGDEGVFRIARGTNTAMIESNFVYGYLHL